VYVCSCVHIKKVPSTPRVIYIDPSKHILKVEFPIKVKGGNSFMGKNNQSYMEIYRQKIGSANITDYKHPDNVAIGFNNYLDLCWRAGISPTFEGMMADMFKSKSSYVYYRSKENLKEVFEYIDLVLADITINGKLSDSMKGMILKNKCGYSEKVETVNTNNNNFMITPDEKERMKKELKEKFDIEVVKD
jgi:hypothetical protein